MRNVWITVPCLYTRSVLLLADVVLFQTFPAILPGKWRGIQIQRICSNMPDQGP